MEADLPAMALAVKQLTREERLELVEFRGGASDDKNDKFLEGDADYARAAGHRGIKHYRAAPKIERRSGVGVRKLVPRQTVDSGCWGCGRATVTSRSAHHVYFNMAASRLFQHGDCWCRPFRIGRLGRPSTHPPAHAWKQVVAGVVAGVGGAQGSPLGAALIMSCCNMEDREVGGEWHCRGVAHCRPHRGWNGSGRQRTSTGARLRQAAAGVAAGVWVAQRSPPGATLISL